MFEFDFAVVSLYEIALELDGKAKPLTLSIPLFDENAILLLFGFIFVDVLIINKIKRITFKILYRFKIEIQLNLLTNIF